MNDRMNRVLDDDLPRESLSAEESAQIRALEGATAALRTELLLGAPRDMDTRVMARIRALDLVPAPAPTAPVLLKLVRAAWSPRELRLRLRPAYALAAAAVLALVLLRPGSAPQTVFVEPPAAAEKGAPIYVQFRLEAASASSVALAGSFSDWQPTHALQQTAPGVWTTVLSVPAGVHDYVFVVNGELVPDPHAPQVDDGFGGVSSRLAVLAPAREL